MKKIVRLTEQDLVRLVNKVLNEQVDNLGTQYSAQLDKLIKKYSNDLCNSSGKGKVFPYDEEVKKLQILINKGEGKVIVKEDGMLGPKTKQYICSGGI